MFRKFLETSDIISLQGGDSQYFGKKFQKLFQVEKNPTLTFKIGGRRKKKKEKRERKIRQIKRKEKRKQKNRKMKKIKKKNDKKKKKKEKGKRNKK